jgi:hypothetical protein
MLATMMRRPVLVAVIAACIVAASCGYPSFQFGPGGTGGAATTASRSAAASSSSGVTAASSTTTAASSSGNSASTGSSSSGASCGIGHLVISEIRSRGKAGASDEFIELYNPTDADAVLDSGWTIDARSATSLGYSQRWVGGGGVIPKRGHFLIVGSSYTQSPSGDDDLSQSIGDAESVMLSLDGAPVSVVCYYYGPLSLLALQDGGYTCDMMPVANPHDDNDDTDVDQSIERKPGGAAGNCTNTGDNAADFTISSPSTPENSHSAPAPG